MIKHRVKKRFGQHFLTDPYVIDQIIQYFAPRPGQNIIEIGPGLAALTQPLLKQSHNLTVIEIDNDIIDSLRQRFDHADLTILGQDVLTVDFHDLAKPAAPMRIIGNLPYNIATEVIFHILTSDVAVQDLLFMCQKEVIDRFAAQPGDKHYGRLSVMAQRFCQIVPLFTVEKQAFTPPPKVTSTVAHFKVYDENPYPDLAYSHDFACFIAQMFCHKRKTLYNNLKRHFPQSLLNQLPIDLHGRPNMFSLEKYIEIYTFLSRSAKIMAP